MWLHTLNNPACNWLLVVTSYTKGHRCVLLSWCFTSTETRWLIRDRQSQVYDDDDEVMLNVLRCQLTYLGQVVTNAEARCNNSLHPWKPEGSLGRTAQDGHLNSHTAPELWHRCIKQNAYIYSENTKKRRTGGRRLVRHRTGNSAKYDHFNSHHISFLTSYVHQWSQIQLSLSLVLGCKLKIHVVFNHFHIVRFLIPCKF